uniref:Uncharacterized protein n=1 Tax=Caenorhabditis japonica TaxID=281687 RepID=A0A8R1EN22_CAEJA
MFSTLVILAYATTVIKDEPKKPKLDCWDQNLADRIVILLNQHEEGHQETVLTSQHSCQIRAQSQAFLEIIFTRDDQNKDISKMLEEFKILLKRDPVFRSTEFFVHESQPSYYQPSSSTEQSVKQEEPVVLPENDISIEKTVDVVAHEDTYY